MEAETKHIKQQVREWGYLLIAVVLAIGAGYLLNRYLPSFASTPISGTSFVISILVLFGVVDWLRRAARSPGRQEEPFSFRILRKAVFLVAVGLGLWSMILGMAVVRSQPASGFLHVATGVVVVLVVAAATLRRFRLHEIERSMGRFIIVQKRLERNNPYHPPAGVSLKDLKRRIDDDIDVVLDHLVKTLDHQSWNLVHFWQRKQASGFPRMATVWEPLERPNDVRRFRCEFREPKDEHPLGRMLDEYMPVELQPAKYFEFFDKWDAVKKGAGSAALLQPAQEAYWEEKHGVTSLAGALWYCFERGQKTGVAQRFDKYVTAELKGRGHGSGWTPSSRYLYVKNVEKLSVEDQFFDHHHIRFIEPECCLRSVYMRVLASGEKRLGILMILDCVPSPLNGRTDLDFIEAYAGVLEILLGRRTHLATLKEG